jgi:signal transduction protein with GAF and PtsI domain
VTLTHNASDRLTKNISTPEIPGRRLVDAQSALRIWFFPGIIFTALVVDIGGALSHAAVVARELGIPCVVSTGHGTKLIKTGDQVRVDGSTGKVEILARRSAR